MNLNIIFLGQLYRYKQRQISSTIEKMKYLE